jgi:hypothetical protein
MKEAYRPFSLEQGIKSSIAIANSVTGRSHATTPAMGFNKGDLINTFLKVSCSASLLKEVYKNSTNNKALMISIMSTDFFILC